jgi:predicted DNA-binding antitoxin AbrB/MazE fold protein
MANLQELQDLEDLEVEKVEEPAPKPLQKLKIKKGEKPVTEDAVQDEEPVKKTRKPKTEKQLEVFAKAREKMLLNLKEALI